MRKLKPEIKAFEIIHTVMLLSQIAFATIVYFLVKNKSIEVDSNLNKALQAFAVFATISGVGLGLFLFSKKIKEMQMIEGLSVNEKINHYRAALIIKLALMEGPCLLSIVGLFLTGNISFLFLAIALILFFALQRPTVMAMTLLLRVSNDDLYEE